MEKATTEKPRSDNPRIVIEFDDNNVAKFDISGPVNAYMLHGAAGILKWQADMMMQKAEQARQDIAIVRAPMPRQ